eukprot:351899-Chlamydomonas_euryale.AAC.1
MREGRGPVVTLVLERAGVERNTWWWSGLKDSTCLCGLQTLQEGRVGRLGRVGRQESARVDTGASMVRAHDLRALLRGWGGRSCHRREHIACA